MSQGEVPGLQAAVRSMRVILLSLMMGVASFIGVDVFVIVSMGPLMPAAPDWLPPFLALLGVPLMVMPLAILPVIEGGARERHADLPEAEFDDRMLALKRGNFVIALAMCEGPAFMSCVAYLCSGEAWTLSVAVIALVLMAARFPTVEGLTRWLQRQREWRAERQLTAR